MSKNWLLIPLIAGLAACGAGAVPLENAGGPAESTAQVSDDLNVQTNQAIDPANTIGIAFLTDGLVQLTFDDRNSRGIEFKLQQRKNHTWLTTHYLRSTRTGMDPLVTPLGGPDVQYLVHVEGPGPDIVAIPHNLQSGDWRICTRTDDEVCGIFTGEARSGTPNEELELGS